MGVFIGIFGHSVSEAQARQVRKWKKNNQSTLLRLLFTDYKSEKRKERDKDNLKDTFLSDHELLLDDIIHVLREEYPQIILVMVLGWILGYREGWPLTSTIYFCIMSASTTGFGDYVPKSQIDKVYCIFFFPISVAVFGEVLGKICSVYIDNKFRKHEQTFLKRAVTLCDLDRMDANDDGDVDLAEFLSFMLVALGKVDRDSIDELKAVFDSLDKDGNGILRKEDLVEIAEESPLMEIQEELIAEEEQTEEDQRSKQSFSSRQSSSSSKSFTFRALFRRLSGQREGVLPMSPVLPTSPKSHQHVRFHDNQVGELPTTAMAFHLSSVPEEPRPPKKGVIICTSTDDGLSLIPPDNNLQIETASKDPESLIIGQSAEAGNILIHSNQGKTEQMDSEIQVISPSLADSSLNTNPEEAAMSRKVDPLPLPDDNSNGKVPKVITVKSHSDLDVKLDHTGASSTS